MIDTVIITLMIVIAVLLYFIGFAIFDSVMDYIERHKRG